MKKVSCDRNKQLNCRKVAGEEEDEVNEVLDKHVKGVKATVYFWSLHLPSCLSSRPTSQNCSQLSEE